MGMTEAAYDAIAEWYDGWVGAGPILDDPHFAAVVPLLGQVAGQRVCDLGCGQGRVARYLADQGARVVGVDISSRMLAIAREREARDPRGIDYLLADAHGLPEIRDAALDGVLCHMALMDIPDLGATVRTVSRILRPGGWFVFSILHPCYNTESSGEFVGSSGALCRYVGRYFVEGHWRSDIRPGPPGKVGVYHRTLSTYVNTLLDCDLAVERMAELRATGAFAERRPIWSEVPSALIVRCRKTIRNDDRGGE